MTRRELIQTITAAAEPVYGECEAAAIARLVAEKLYGLSRADLALSPDAELPLSADNCFSSKTPLCNALEKFAKEHTPAYVTEQNFEKKEAESQSSRKTDLLTDIAAARPVQYILGVADFAGLELAVGEGVLIPRPETEELVRWITDDVPSSRTKLEMPAKGFPCRILDIGTGSGAIAIALAKSLPGANITAIDISPVALEYARINNEKYSAGVTFHEADILSFAEDTISTLYDVIVSNPPYIPSAERARMADNVTKYEPAEALFVPDDDHLLFYRAIARFARRSLSPSGALYFEIHEDMADRVAGLLAAEGFRRIEIREDINSKQRMVKCLP